MKLELKSTTVTLRSGETVDIRPMVPRDAQALLAFYRELPEEDRLFLDDDVTQDDWVKRLMSRVDYDNNVPLVAVHDGNIQGHATLIRTHFGWMAHVGQIRVVVARPFQHKGLGKALVRELMKIAVSAGLEKMTARMMDNQVGACRAFEKLGFKVEATFKGFVKDTHGKRRNMLLMANDVSHIWQAMDALVSDTPPTREQLY
ncbi:MAG: GNAT family N-acetyltransferase [bacterium]